MDDIDHTMNNRRIARKLMGDAASKGNDLAGAMAELEVLASPFFLGIDEDEDEDSADLDVWP